MSDKDSEQESAQEIIYPWRAKNAHLSSDVEYVARNLAYTSNSATRPDVATLLVMEKITERDMATRRTALEDACRAICEECEDGVPLKDPSGQSENWLMHICTGADTIYGRTCAASPIRLKLKEDTND